MTPSKSPHSGRAFAPLTSSPSRSCFEVREGDVLRSKYGRATRTVVAIDGDNVILLAKTGSVQSIPRSSAETYWYKLHDEE